MVLKGNRYRSYLGVQVMKGFRQSGNRRNCRCAWPSGQERLVGSSNAPSQQQPRLSFGMSPFFGVPDYYDSGRGMGRKQGIGQGSFGY